MKISPFTSEPQNPKYTDDFYSQHATNVSYSMCCGSGRLRFRDHPARAGKAGDLWFGFDRRVRLAFQGSKDQFG